MRDGAVMLLSLPMKVLEMCDVIMTFLTFAVELMLDGGSLLISCINETLVSPFRKLHCVCCKTKIGLC